MQSEYRSGLFWRLFDAVSQALDRRIGWHRLPTPLGLLSLIGVRNILRRRNLFDTEQLPSTGTAAAGAVGAVVPDRALGRRHLQRPRAARDGPGGIALRAQRAARAHRARVRARADVAEPAHGQPRADDAPRVPGGDRAQLARHGLAAVHDPRLVRSRQGPGGRRLGGPAGGLRPVAGAPDDHPADAGGPDAAAGRDGPADLRQHGDALVGRLAALRQSASATRCGAARRSTASCGSAPTAGSTCPTIPPLEPDRGARLVARAEHHGDPLRRSSTTRSATA